ncbi:MAG: DUF7309 domain-containing protein [Clostridium sp.]
MRKEASLKQWEDLYEVAIKLKEMKPWEELWDMDIITILEDNDSEPCYCSVMGRGGECYGIGAYIGVKSIKGFFEMANSKGVPPSQLIRYQNTSLCNFGDRKELTNKELNIIKELGLKFRGKNNWIYFRVFETGYEPYMPDEPQVKELTKILRHLYMAIKSLHNGIKVDFESGNTLLRKFDKERNLWINFETPLYIPQRDYPIININDEVFVQRIIKEKKTSEVVELDIAILNSTIRDKEFEKPIIHRRCILADVKKGIILDHTMITPNDDEIDNIFGILINYIKQRGKPKKVVVRDKATWSLLSDIGKKFDINIEIKGRLKVIDDFVQMF